MRRAGSEVSRHPRRPRRDLHGRRKVLHVSRRDGRHRPGARAGRTGCRREGSRHGRAGTRSLHAAPGRSLATECVPHPADRRPGGAPRPSAVDPRSPARRPLGCGAREPLRHEPAPLRPCVSAGDRYDARAVRRARSRRERVQTARGERRHRRSDRRFLRFRQRRLHASRFRPRSRHHPTDFRVERQRRTHPDQPRGNALPMVR